MTSESSVTSGLPLCLLCCDRPSLSWSSCFCWLCCSHETSTYRVLVSVQCCFRPFLMCISLRISDGTPISRSLSTISISSLERCHFKSFVHVWIMLCFGYDCPSRIFVLELGPRCDDVQEMEYLGYGPGRRRLDPCKGCPPLLGEYVVFSFTGTQCMFLVFCLFVWFVFYTCCICAFVHMCRV